MDAEHGGGGRWHGSPPPPLPRPTEQPPRKEKPPPPAKPDHLRLGKSTPCCVCEGPEKAWKCLQCDDSFCNSCWSKQRPHQPGKVGLDGRQHEQVDEAVIKQLQNIFADVSSKEQQRRHEADKNTTWFGVHHDEDQPYLEHTNRLVDILQDGRSGVHDERFPHLVSFVGQTGAGKSTIIKMLMNYTQDGVYNPRGYPAPVPGLVGDNISTTGNVHLYADMQTYDSKQPILYADCEGLAGGGNRPRGLVRWEGLESVKHPRTYVKQNLRALTRLKLKWADIPSRSRREFAVTNLFPRILYTFSDVVVFVLREARTFESHVLKLLIDWAAKSIDKSVNQPSRPHIIIVLNQTDPAINEEEWNPNHATERLLNDFADSVKHIGALKEVVAKLEGAGLMINTTKDLLEFYYSSITVVRIPSKGRYMQMYTQVKLLHEAIGSKCSESYHQKQTIRMALNSERLPQYVNKAYHHFSRHLDKPFDFVEEAHRHMPLPKSFGEHMLNLMLSIYKHSRDNITTTFTKLCRPVAACIMLAAMRDNIQGPYSSILHKAYKSTLQDAFFQFCNSWLRCSFQRNSQQCCNTKYAHEKGHQAESGKLLSKGAYQSPFDANSSFSEWIRNIDHQIRNLNAPVEISHRDERDFVPVMHRSVMNDFYNETVAKLELKSHLTCLYCLQKIPSNPLPCGHMLCKACVRSCGETRGQGIYQLRECPLHPTETRWPSPVYIRFKPQDAGVRVLCLDGGGIRGIVELAILRKMDDVLGNHVPIQNFFDLIVGTSTGGIIALGLGVKGWTVEQCTTHFKNLCRQAFTPRGPSLLKPFTIVGFKSYYRTKPLEAVLRSAFDDNTSLYGDHKVGSPASIRVAVTATAASDGRPTILSNYNTEAERSHMPYGFLRPHDPNKELKVWQAARATSAAPPHFKDFTHSDASYIDGAMHYNCPVEVADQERRLLWEEVSDWPADLVLSLGTGYTDKSSEMKLAIHRERSFVPFGNVLRIASRMLETQLDCEEIWKRYYHGVMVREKMQRDEKKDRNIRINLKFAGKRPAIDDATAVDDIERQAQNDFQNNRDIWRAAHKLVATSFYFEKENIESLRDGSYQCSGKILCRFGEGSHDLKGLGFIMQRLVKGDFVPCFLIQDCNAKDTGSHRVEFPLRVMDDMQKRGLFTLPPIIGFSIPHYDSETNISLCVWPDSSTYETTTTHDEAALFSISGFPRHLYSPHAPSPPKEDSDNGDEASWEPLDGASVDKSTDEVSVDDDPPDGLDTSRPSISSSPSIGSSGASLRSKYTLLGRGIQLEPYSDAASMTTFRTAETKGFLGRVRSPFRG